PTDSKFVWNAGTVTLPDPNQFGIFEGLAFAMDDQTDTGPFNIYIDNLRNGTNLVQDFENEDPGTLAVQFAKPGNSGTTSANLLGAPDLSAVSSNSAAYGTNSANISWQFNGVGAGKWLRLNGLGSAGNVPTPNPELDMTLPIAVDILIQPVGKTNSH